MRIATSFLPPGEKKEEDGGSVSHPHQERTFLSTLISFCLWLTFFQTCICKCARFLPSVVLQLRPLYSSRLVPGRQRILGIGSQAEPFLQFASQGILNMCVYFGYMIVVKFQPTVLFAFWRINHKLNSVTFIPTRYV